MNDKLRDMPDIELQGEFDRYSLIRDRAQERVNAIGAEINRRLNATVEKITAAKSLMRFAV